MIHKSHKGGSPKYCGLNPSSDRSLKVAGALARKDTRGSGTRTTCMPADRAASIPTKEDSKTRHLLGSGDSSKREAVVRKTSGAGFPLLTSSSEPLKTTWWKTSKSLECRRVFILNESRQQPLAIAMGMLNALR